MYYYSKQGSKKVVGIDISKRAIDYANKYNKNENLEYKVMDISDIDKLEDKFDFVISDMVVNYINDFNATLKNI